MKELLSREEQLIHDIRVCARVMQDECNIPMIAIAYPEVDDRLHSTQDHILRHKVLTAIANVLLGELTIKEWNYETIFR